MGGQNHGGGQNREGVGRVDERKNVCARRGGFEVQHATLTIKALENSGFSVALRNATFWRGGATLAAGFGRGNCGSRLHFRTFKPIANRRSAKMRIAESHPAAGGMIGSNPSGRG